ncbi:zinc finger protein GIS2-like [Cephus cinctus]|uniref:Zinc finger protein GIS2-like n=1 Tax=Cephus cinctus TaxID=211228 RepID=A0AAJ7RQB2_CEPCN|nr:zinc finger protein GIS2-like [Cephus cinctus]
MNGILERTREEFDSLVKYGNETRNYVKGETYKVEALASKCPPLKSSGSSKTNESETGRTQASRSAMMANKCYNCNEFGHLGRDCPRQGTNVKMCYECREFVTHRAAQCPQRLANSKDRRTY